MTLAKRLLPLAVGILAVSASALHADCLVTPVEVVDYSRSSGLPYASPADSGAQPTRIRTLVWSPGSASARPSYADLIVAVAAGVDPSEHLTSRLRFYGATVDPQATTAAVARRALCGRTAVPSRPSGGIVLVVAAFPPVLYEGAAAALAERGVATVVLTGNESAVRLVINHLAALGWPVDRLALVGHGAGGPVAQLMAMSNTAVRGVVSLDGFEALDRRRHPGLTGDPAWRPGNVRAPVLHWRPANHPDADSAHHRAAARSALTQVTLTGIAGKQWMTAPEVALAPEALRPLLGPEGAAAQAAVTQHTVDFLVSTLSNRPFDANAFAGGLRRSLGTGFEITTRAPLSTPAIRTDGRLDETVWREARTLPDATDVSVRVTEDCDYLYVAIVPRRSSPFITELFVRGAANGPTISLPLNERDLLLHTSASLCWAYGKAEVAPADCNKSEAWWGASRTNQAGDPSVAEYLGAKTALGLPRCSSAAGLRIGALTGGWGQTTTYPAGVRKDTVATWGRIP